jgi:hypothetical protein
VDPVAGEPSSTRRRSASRTATLPRAWLAVARNAGTAADHCPRPPTGRGRVGAVVAGDRFALATPVVSPIQDEYAGRMRSVLPVGTVSR